MAETQASPSPRPDSGGASSSSPPPPSSSSRGSWYATIPAPLQRLFDAVPLVTYPPNELPYRSPGATDLPTLHVFISEEDAARGSPSFNPSCLKWQTFLRMAGVQFHLRPSTNHASPTGALPFLQPPTPSVSTTTTTTTSAANTKAAATPATGRDHPRLDPRPLLPVPASRLGAYAARHGRLTPEEEEAAAVAATTTTTTPQPPSQAPQAQPRRRAAYQSLLDGPLRAAWLHALYLSPANEHLLRRWYVDPLSRSAAVRETALGQLRRAVRAEVARSSSSLSPSSSSSSAAGSGGGGGGGGGGWSLSGNARDVLAWAAGGAAAIDPARVYAEAARALEALEALLGLEGEAGAGGAGGGGQGRWFFGAPHPTVFDAAVFSYVYLILHGGGPATDGEGRHKPWADDTLRRIVAGRCPRLVAHARRILDEYWPDQVEQGWVDLYY